MQFKSLREKGTQWKAFCVSWGLPNTGRQPDASPGEHHDRSGYLKSSAARGEVPSSYCQAWTKWRFMRAGSLRNPKSSDLTGKERGVLCTDPACHTKLKSSISKCMPTSSAAWKRTCFPGLFLTVLLSSLDQTLPSSLHQARSSFLRVTADCTSPAVLHGSSEFHSNKRIFHLIFPFCIDLVLYP